MDQDEDELADHLDPRRIAMLLLDSVRGSESLEVSLDAACELVYRSWAHESDDIARFVTDTAGSSPSLRSISPAGANQLASAVRRFVPRGQWGHSRVFEALVELREERLARAGRSYSSHHMVERLMAGLVGPGKRLLDPACGLGGTLIAAEREELRDVAWGVDISEDVASLASMRAELQGTQASIGTFDFLQGAPTNTSTFLSGAFPTEWDAIVAEPPMGTKVRVLDQDIRAQTLDGDAHWLATIAAALAAGGRAVVLLPASFSSRSGESRKLRVSLLEQGRVDIVIAMPAGSVLSTSIPTHLWVISGPNRQHQDHVLMVNASAAVAGNARSHAEGVRRTLETCQRWLETRRITDESAWFARSVATGVLLSDGDTSPTRYLDTPPKREQPRPESPSHLLSELRLEGFKSVDREARVPLRPLTLIYGRNSSGKSSVIQSLLLVRQSLTHDSLQPNGEFVRLGSYAGLVHGQDESRNIRIGLTFASDRSIDSGIALPDPLRLRSVDLTLGSDIDGRGMRVLQARVALGEHGFVWDVEEGEDRWFQISSEDVIPLVNLAYTADSIYPPRPRSSPDQGRRVRGALRSAEMDRVKVARNGILPAAVAGETLDDLSHRTSGHTHQGVAEGALKTATALTHAIAEETRNLLERVSYLGPLRQAPERISARSSATTGLDVPFFLLDNISERQQASTYLQRLGVPYELDAILVSDQFDRRILGDAAAIVLTDKRSGVRLSPADVGFGISQVLPIVVELSARTNAIIIVEQPEIHLHPAMQADLADLVIESVQASGRANQVILETHSETLMLRVQRRIREGVLNATEVAVIYVDQDSDGRAIARELRMDDRGEFIDDWPHGFFVERFDEVFGDLT